MSATIDQDGNAQVWIATYWRFYGKYEEECDSLEDALSFLNGGEDAGSLSSESIKDPDGRILLEGDALSKARWAYEESGKLPEIAR